MALRRNRTTAAESNPAGEIASETLEATKADAPPFAEDPEQAAAEVQKDLNESGGDVPSPAAEKASPPAVTKPAGAPARIQDNAAASVDALAAAGYEGLEIGFGSFPIIVLDSDGEFKTNEGAEIGEEFQGIILETRAKYVLKNTKCEKKEEEAHYSYDKTTTTDGDSIDEIIEDWKEQGWGYEIKEYIEGVIERPDEDGAVYLISVPPTSRRKLSGYIVMTGRRTGLLPNQYVTKFKVGDKVTGVDNPFYPWAFEFVGPVE